MALLSNALDLGIIIPLDVLALRFAGSSARRKIYQWQDRTIIRPVLVDKSGGSYRSLMVRAFSTDRR